MSTHDDHAADDDADLYGDDAHGGSDTGDIILAAASAAQALEKFGHQLQMAQSAHDPALKELLRLQMADAKRHVARIMGWMRQADPDMDAAFVEEAGDAVAADAPEEHTSPARAVTRAHAPAPPPERPAPAPIPAPVPAAPAPPTAPVATTSGPHPPVPQGAGPVTFVRDVRLNPNTRIRG